MAALAQSAVIVSSNKNAQTVFKDGLSRTGCTQVKVHTSASEALKDLTTDESAMLILDADIGQAESSGLLADLALAMKADCRVILLFAVQATNGNLALAREYAVSYFHVGNVSPSEIGVVLAKVDLKEKTNSQVREVLATVARKRELEDYEDAERYMLSFLDKMNSNSRFMAELAELQIQLGKWEEARDHLEPFLTSEPAYVRGLHLLGRAEMKLGDFQAATHALEKAKSVNPEHFDRLILLGQSYLELGETDLARGNFKDAAKLDRKAEAPKIGLGQCHLVEGNLDDAISLFGEAASVTERISVFNTSAVLAARHGHFDSGLALYDMAFQLAKDDSSLLARIVFNKGVAYARQNDGAKAAELFKEATRLDPKFTKAQKLYDQVTGVKPKETPVMVDDDADDVSQVADFEDFSADYDDDMDI